MAYFLMTHRGVPNCEAFLTEMPAKQLSQRLRDYPSSFYSRISAKEAHERVLRGDRHGTLLYVENGKIRRSKEG